MYKPNPTTALAVRGGGQYRYQNNISTSIVGRQLLTWYWRRLPRERLLEKDDRNSGSSSSCLYLFSLSRLDCKSISFGIKIDIACKPLHHKGRPGGLNVAASILQLLLLI